MIELPELRHNQILWGFSLAVIDRYKVIASGGYSEKMRTSSLVFLFDTREKAWLTNPAMPNLNEPRVDHAACSSDRHTFVFGGVDRKNKFKNSLEMLCLRTLEEQAENRRARWISIDLPDLQVNSKPLMVALNSQELVIIGGMGNRWNHDGIILDIYSGVVKSRKNFEFRLESESQSIITEQGKIQTLTQSDMLLLGLVEISVQDW